MNHRSDVKRSLFALHIYCNLVATENLFAVTWYLRHSSKFTSAARFFAISLHLGRDLVARHFTFSVPSSLPSLQHVTTMAEIKIDKNLFQERLSHLISAWKADKRTGDALFGGASSILILMGKSEENAQFQKNNAIHVWTHTLELCAVTRADWII